MTGWGRVGDSLPPWVTWIPHALADLLRGAVRCAVPLFVIAAFAGLLFSDQGRDVILVLVERGAPEKGSSIGGLLFLGAGSAALSLSLWYSMRWLLTAQMPSLRLNGEPGLLRSWLPRLVGAAAPGLVALNLYTLMPDDAAGRSAHFALHAGHGFLLLTVLLLAFYWVRGNLMTGLQRRGLIDAPKGRRGNRPGEIDIDEPLPDLTLRIIVWSTALSMLAAIQMMLFPLTLPRVFGAAAVAALALASINLFGSFVLSYLPLRNGVPHLAPWVVLWAGLIGSCNDNHVVQPAPSTDQASTVRVDAVKDFGEFLKRLDPHGNAPVPVLFIASEGGGIRAAYWTAAVLEELRKRVPRLEEHTYALSGVSGGSVGLAAWVVSRRADLCPQAGAGGMPAALTDSLGMDFVSPAVAGLLYYDLIQRFIPAPVGAWDRSRTLEEGWQRAFSHSPGRPLEQTLPALYRGCDRLPQLLLNSTVVETGQRAVLTRLDTNPAQPGPIFVDHFDAMSEKFTTRTQSLAGLMHHSARFPAVSPAGTIEEITAGKRVPAFRLVDGGYFDNSGMQTALELIDYLRRHVRQEFTPILVMVRNAADTPPSCPVPPCNQEPSGVFPEAGSILGALLAVRGAHAVAARESAERMVKDVVLVDLVVAKGTAASRAPLGWSLSDSVKKALKDEAVNVAKKAAAPLNQRLAAAPEPKR